MQTGSQPFTRRQFLTHSIATAALTALPTPPVLKKAKKLGVAAASYAIRWRTGKTNKKFPSFSQAIDMLEHCHRIGAGGIQTSVREWTGEFGRMVRNRREELGVFLEGQILLPQDTADVLRFESEVKQAREAGIGLLRTVCLRGRRYETFQSLKEFKSFRAKSYQALEWAEPIVRKYGIKLAVENHKDWRINEMLELMEHLESSWIGVTLDTGNNLALLEDPMAVVTALAPYTMTIHFKDMGLETYKDGFLLAEVPLGKGFLDLTKIRQICESHRPEVTFNLEMITRDPLPIPCFSDRYWATFGNSISGREAARTLALVQSHEAERPLPRINRLNRNKQLALEEKNILASLKYAKDNLGFV